MVHRPNLLSCCESPAPSVQLLFDVLLRTGQIRVGRWAAGAAGATAGRAGSGAAASGERDGEEDGAREVTWVDAAGSKKLPSASNTGTSSIMSSTIPSMRFGPSPRESGSVALSARPCPPPRHPRKVVVVVQIELNEHLLALAVAQLADLDVHVL